MKILAKIRFQRILRLVLLACIASTLIGTALAQSDRSATKLIISEREYIIRDGDTLRRIAQKELGKIGLAPDLAEFNGFELDKILQIGDVIKIPLYAEVAKEFATVVYLKGEVQRSGESIERNDEVYVNELITTGDDGFVSMMFKSGSVINLQPNTHAKLVRLNCLDDDKSCLIEVESDQGELTSDVESHEKQATEFRITTPYASAAVRGTIFDVAVDESQLGVGVTEGGVAISTTAESVDLDTGFGSTTKRGEPIGQPVPLLPTPVYRYIPARAAKGDRISWWNLSDASDYLAQLSTDNEGRSVVSSVVGQQTDYAVGDIDAGDYYLNIRGIDNNGLKGFVSSARVIIAQIVGDVEPVETEIEFDGNEYLVSVIDPTDDAPGYEIQVSSDPDFNSPISVDISGRSAAVFRIDSDKIYGRARVLLTPQRVSAFGAVSESP